MKYKILFFLCLCIASLNAQESIKPQDLIRKLIDQETTFQEINLLQNSPLATRNQLPKELLDAETFTFNEEVASSLVSSSLSTISIILPSRYRDDLKLRLSEVNIPPFSVVEGKSGLPIKYQMGKHYRGIISGKENSLVAISIYEDEMMGLISDGNLNGNLVLGKLANESTHVLYRDPDMIQKLGLDCATDENGNIYPSDVIRNTDLSRALSDCVGFYFEVDNDIVNDKGGAVAATDYVTGLYNQVATLYANENINTNISEIVVWTTPSPYNSTSSVGMLNDFTSYRQGFNGDLAMLLSYKASGGIAYVNGLCSANPDYSMSFSSIGSNYTDVPTFSWSVMVVAHEFGHLLGSQHTHACVWNGNGTAIDGCYSTEGSCPLPGIPSDGGTIMSYCHLTSAGINLSKGFGTQPGNVIRSRVTAASCTQACDDHNNNPDNENGDSCQFNNATLTLTTDLYPGETTWSITDTNGAIIYSGGPYNNRESQYTIDLCLPYGCYNFTIYDSYGDGICCDYGIGEYVVESYGDTLIYGGLFDSEETQNFCLDSVIITPPTCEDGIQNGEETGIDCGGPECPECPTTSEEVIFGHYFENDWDNWQDGGSDCARYRGVRSPEGNYSIRLRDNSGLASAMTSENFDLSKYERVKLEFMFYAYSMEYGEDFLVSIYDGENWVRLARGIAGQNFNNNIVYSATLELSSDQVNFASNAQLRFQCDASSNLDHVYIDAIVLTGFNGVSDLASSQLLFNELSQTIEDTQEISLFPNPVSETLHITMTASEEEINTYQYTLFDIAGQVIKSGIIPMGNASHSLDVSAIHSGTYLLQMKTASEKPWIKKVTIIK